MATPLSEIIDVIEAIKSTEVNFVNTEIPVKHAKLGVTQCALALGKDYTMTTQLVDDGTGNSIEKIYINEDLTTKEVYLAGLFAVRNFFFQEHHSLTQKAVNFKTINFAVTGLTERAKELMRIVWWCDTEIKTTIDNMYTIKGSSQEMRGEMYGS